MYGPDFLSPVAFGDATSFNTPPPTYSGRPAGIAANPSGGGYWLVGSDGGVFAFGDAAFHGSLGSAHLNAPIVGIAATLTGAGYWLVGSDGGVFAFGDAAFHGSLGGRSNPYPIGSMAVTNNAAGYWLLPTPATTVTSVWA